MPLDNSPYCRQAHSEHYLFVHYIFNQPKAESKNYHVHLIQLGASTSWIFCLARYAFPTFFTKEMTGSNGMIKVRISTFVATIIDSE